MSAVKALLLALLPAFLAAIPGAAEAAGCREIEAGGRGYTVCEASAGADLRLFLYDADGTPFGTFERLRRSLEAGGERLVFAMNAGMYHPDRRPVGLYIENGSQLAQIVTRAGPGNFGMLPNGVFCIGAARFRVVESIRYRDAPPECRFASQSGPMLVIGGALHPRFLPGSTSRYVRNGVGASADGKTAYFVISNSPVTFYEFALVFRDTLGLSDALYFDGSVSKLYAPGLGRADAGRQMGPMLGLVAPGG